jgi:hypothetical protein
VCSVEALCRDVQARVWCCPSHIEGNGIEAADGAAVRLHRIAWYLARRAGCSFRPPTLIDRIHVIVRRRRVGLRNLGVEEISLRTRVVRAIVIVVVGTAVRVLALKAAAQPGGHCSVWVAEDRGRSPRRGAVVDDALTLPCKIERERGDRI